MNKVLKWFFLSIAGCLMSVEADAQLSSNPDKFLGNITTEYNVDYGSEPFYTLWNQITCENESKWDQIEGSRRGSFFWTNCDRAYNYAKQHGFPFKFHTLVWGSQYPQWMNNLSTSEQYAAIVEWMDAIKARYPDLQMIDVVNEAIASHAPAPYKAALGGDGKTGYDWIIKAFEMAYERWPNAILIYNDYNTFQWNTQDFINLVSVLRDSGAPIDAYGCQSHDLTDISLSDFKSSMNQLQNALKMPMYSTEYDIGTTDDNKQLQQYKNQIPYMWESDYCAGITLWGYIYGKTWTTGGNSGIIKDGEDRPAMKWLREYMQTAKAKQAKSPFPGMVKEASVYVKSGDLRATKGDLVPITVRARLRTKTLDHVDLYVNNTLFCTKTTAPFTADYPAENVGKHDVKVVVFATDGTKYERYSAFTVYNQRTPFNGEISLPGTLEAENFDSGAEGITYHDADNKDDGGVNYRSDNGGVDIVGGNTGYALGYTEAGEWLEYTINVKEAGLYSFDASVSSGYTTSSFSLSLNTDNGIVPISDVMPVPCVKANSWDTYRTVHGRLTVPLQEGRQILRLNIVGSSLNIDNIVFRRYELNPDIQLALTANPTPATVNETVTLQANITSSVPVSRVRFYENNVLKRTDSTQPYQHNYKPTEKGTITFTAIAIDTNGKESGMATFKLNVYPKRTPYNSMAVIPGTIEVENFDQGGEGFTFHDSDDTDEGAVSYRSDNEGVDIVGGGTGYGIGYTAANEWLEYSVNVLQSGYYTYEAYASSGIDNSGFRLSLSNDGQQTRLCQVNVPNTDSWNTYQTIKGNLNVPLTAGNQILRLTITGPYCNVDYIKLVCTVPTGINTLSADSEPDAPLYNLSGQRVSSDYRGIVIKNGKKTLKR